MPPSSDLTTHVFLEGLGDLESVTMATLEVPQETERVEFGDFLDVAEDYVALASESLWDVESAHLGKVMLEEEEEED